MDVGVGAGEFGDTIDVDFGCYLVAVAFVDDERQVVNLHPGDGERDGKEGAEAHR